MQRDRRSHGRAVGGRAAPQGRVHVPHRSSQAEMVHRSAGQPCKTPRSEPLNHHPEVMKNNPFVLYLIIYNIMDYTQRSLKYSIRFVNV